MVEGPQNHRKTIKTNGLGAGNHLMVMVEGPQNNRKQLKAMVSGLKNIKWKWLAKKNDYIQWFPSDHYNLTQSTYVCML